MAATGWVKLHRCLTTHPLWAGERFTRGQAWVDLILEAAFEDHESFATHGPSWIKRGQLLTSQMKLASRWRWDRETVRRFLRELERHGMVRIETSKATATGFTVITILNYEKFQGDGERDAAIVPSIECPIGAPSKNGRSRPSPPNGASTAGAATGSSRTATRARG